jgi:hypothetical protein
MPGRALSLADELAANGYVVVPGLLSEPEAAVTAETLKSLLRAGARSPNDAHFADAAGNPNGAQ